MGANSPGAPRLTQLVALVPLILLDIVVGLWLRLHAGGLVAWVSANVVAVVVTIVTQLLPDDTVKDAKLQFANALRSRKLARLLWVALLGAVVAGSTVSSVHVTPDDPSNRTDLYRVDDLVVVPPWGRNVQLVSQSRRTADTRVYPWKPTSLSYPSQFDSAVTVALLPTGDFIAALADGPLRIAVLNDSGTPAVIADDTLHRVQSLVLSFGNPGTPDSTTRRAWTNIVTTQNPGVDPALAGQLVDDWVQHSRWTRTTQTLKRGDRLRIVVLNAKGDTLASDTLTVSGAHNARYLSHRS
jgi:hypothetical protein